MTIYAKGMPNELLRLQKPMRMARAGSRDYGGDDGLPKIAGIGRSAFAVRFTRHGDWRER